MSESWEYTMDILLAEERIIAALEDDEARWDEHTPQWREESLEWEERDSIPANFVSDPHAPFIARRYGTDYGRIVPGCDGEEY